MDSYSLVHMGNLENTIKLISTGISKRSPLVDNIMGYTADPLGVKGSADAIIAALSGSSDVVYIPKGVFLVEKDFVVPPNKKLSFSRNGRLMLGEGVTITVNGTWEAGEDEWIFDLSKGGVIGGAPSLETIYAEWFGSKGDGIADDLVALRTAISLGMNSRKISMDGGYPLTCKLVLQPKRYRVTDTLTITKSINAVTGTTGRGTQFIIEGAGGINSTIELDKVNGALLNIWDTSVIMRNIGLWAVKGGSTVMILGKDDPVLMYEVRQSIFENVFFRGNVDIRVNRIFDSSFYDCFFAISGNNGVGIDIVKPTVDNCNNINLRRCHFEVSENNCTWIKARGDRLRTDGFHHGFNFDGCHFETRSFTTVILDLDTVNSFAFYRCQLTQNARSNGSDTVASAVTLIKLSNVAGVKFDTCGISRQGDVSTAPRLIKASDVCNAVTLTNIISPSCGDRSGGLKNLIDDSACTTKRGIRLDNSMLTSFGNKASNAERIHLSAGSHNRDWQIFDDSSRVNRNMMIGYTGDSNVDLIPTSDAHFGISPFGQTYSKFGYTGLTTNIPSGGTHVYNLPGGIDANKRGIYLFSLNTNTGLEWGIVNSTGNKLITMMIGSGVENGGNAETSIAGKLNVWCNANGSISFKNLYGSDRSLVVIPFSFGLLFN